jgi:ABC-type arginine transport system permease subunit
VKPNALTLIGFGPEGLFGFLGFFSIPSFAIGVLSVGLVSSACQTEAYRAVYQRPGAGQVEVGRGCGMSGLLLSRRIIAPTHRPDDHTRSIPTESYGGQREERS